MDNYYILMRKQIFEKIQIEIQNENENNPNKTPKKIVGDMATTTNSSVERIKTS